MNNGNIIADFLSLVFRQSVIQMPAEKIVDKLSAIRTPFKLLTKIDGYSDHHSNNRLFSCRTTFDHSNTRLVQYSDPHCSKSSYHVTWLQMITFYSKYYYLTFRLDKNELKWLIWSKSTWWHFLKDISLNKENCEELNLCNIILLLKLRITNGTFKASLLKIIIWCVLVSIWFTKKHIQWGSQ